MSRRSKSTHAIALFPFLAVLVCTMGALIFLLLVTTRMIRKIAVAKAVANMVAQQTPATVEPEPAADVPEPEPTETPAPPIEPEPTPSTDPQIDLRTAALAQRERELEELARQWNQRVTKLSKQKADRVRLLLNRQQQHRTAAQRITSLKDEVQDFESKIGSMSGAAASAAIDSSLKERAELEKHISELKRQLRAAQQSQNGDSAFEVVPFDVNTGTSRRPILIECSESGLRFLPEDVVITPNDLAGFTPQVNPVIAGASTLINYWTAWRLRQPHPSKEPEPYVLLLVRPNGTIAYYKALTALSTLKQPHGYELIEQDTVLQMPPVDLGAKGVLENVVKRLINERNQALRGMSGNRGSPGAGIGLTGGSGGAGGGNGGNGNGGGGGGGGSGGSIQTPGGKFTLADIAPQGSGNGTDDWDQVENFEGRPRRGRGSQVAGGGSGSPNAGGNGIQGSADSSNGSDGQPAADGVVGGFGPIRRARSTSSGSPSESDDATGASGNQQLTGYPQGGNSVGGNQQGGFRQGGNSVGGTQPGGQSGGDPQGGPPQGGNIFGGSQPGGGQSGGYSQRGSAQGANVFGGSQPGGGQTGGDPQGGSAQPGNVFGGSQPGGGQTGGSQQGSYAQSGDQQGGNPSGGNAQGGNQQGGQIGGNPQGGRISRTGATSRSQGSQSQGSQSSSGIESLGDSDDDETSSNRKRDDGSRPDIGTFSANRSGVPVQDQRSRRQKPSGKPMPFEPQQLASHHWGLSDPGATIGLERELRIDVEPTRFVIAGKHAVTVNETDSKDSVFDRMVTVLDLQARDWGRPPQGFFWKPALRFVIADGGDLNYEKIHPLLEQAGLSMTRQFAGDQPAATSAEEKPAAETSPPAKPQPAPPAPKPRRFFWGFSR